MTSFNGFRNEHPPDHVQTVRGIAQELVDRLLAEGGACACTAHGHFGDLRPGRCPCAVSFDPATLTLRATATRLPGPGRGSSRLRPTGAGARGAAAAFISPVSKSSASPAVNDSPGLGPLAGAGVTGFGAGVASSSASAPPSGVFTRSRIAASAWGRSPELRREQEVAILAGTAGAADVDLSKTADRPGRIVAVGPAAIRVGPWMRGTMRQAGTGRDVAETPGTGRADIAGGDPGVNSVEIHRFAVNNVNPVSKTISLHPNARRGNNLPAIRTNLPMTGILSLFSFFFSFQESD
jgi:hypothetical protein